MVKCCLGTWRAEGGSPHTDRKGYVLPETTTMHSLPYTTLAQRKRDNMYKKKRKGAQREKPDKQAKRPGTSKQEDSLVSHNNRGTKPTTTTSIRGDLLVRPSKGEPKLICRHAAWDQRGVVQVFNSSGLETTSSTTKRKRTFPLSEKKECLTNKH